MLGIFLRNLSSRRFQLGTHVLLATASDLTPLELKSFRMAAIDAGATRISFIEEAVASALGAEIRTDFEHAAVVVNMGADTTDIAVVNAGEMVQDRTLRIRTADSPISRQKKSLHSRHLCVSFYGVLRLRVLVNRVVCLLE